MKVQVTYCNHQTADLAVREKLAFATTEQLNAAYGRLRASFPEAELVLISTCNRVEVYTAHEDPDATPTRQQIAQFLADFHSIPLDKFADDLLAESGPNAVRHLFEVVSSVDSMVLGEPQIVSQVKEAYEVSLRNEAEGPLTRALFQEAFRVSKRVRTETRLSEGRVSIASVAVGDFATSIFDRFDDKTVLVIGAGEMAAEALRYLRDEGVGRVLVTNRNLERARDLAREWGGTAASFDELDRYLAEADVIVSATGAERPVVDAERFRRVRHCTKLKPVFILDLGAPRDFDPGVGDVDDGVFLYDIDDLEATCRKNRELRAKEVERARKIIHDETDAFMHDFYHRATGPIIRQLREEWHDVREAEVSRLFAKLQHLDAKDRAEIEKTVERIINKLLHPPLEALRDEAREGTPHGLLDALKRLFGLKD
jgi:glutamyl-tRNA reductase